jgi:hypothetical protein
MDVGEESQLFRERKMNIFHFFYKLLFLLSLDLEIRTGYAQVIHISIRLPVRILPSRSAFCDFLTGNFVIFAI